MAPTSPPPVSDAAMAQVLEELRSLDPDQNARNYVFPKQVNVETLHQQTGLARGTVHNAVTRLERVLHRRRHRDSAARGRRGGKPTTLYRLSAEAGQALVLDFNHDRVSAWRADSIGNVFLLGDERPDVDKEPEKALEAGARLLRKLSAADWRNVVGIGLSIPAPVDPDTHQTLGHVLRSWEDIDLERLLRGHLREQMAGRKVPILADNDANLAALAEYRSLKPLDPDERLSNLVLVKTVPGCIGVGAGAIINGEQLRGRGFAMELGHLSVDTPVREGAYEVECPHCERTDCLQARISTKALIGGGDQAPAWDDVVRWTSDSLFSLREARKSAREANDLDQVENLDTRLRALQTEDANTKAIVIAGEEMGRALAKVATLLDPEVIAFEGALAGAWLDTGPGSMREIVGDPLSKTFVACSRLWRKEPVELTLASSPSNCARGAALAVLDEHLIDFILDRVQ